MNMRSLPVHSRRNVSNVAAPRQTSHRFPPVRLQKLPSSSEEGMALHHDKDTIAITWANYQLLTLASLYFSNI